MPPYTPPGFIAGLNDAAHLEIDLEDTKRSASAFLHLTMKEGLPP